MATYLSHEFVKESRVTRRADIELGQRRYAAMLEGRKGRKRNPFLGAKMMKGSRDDVADLGFSHKEARNRPIRSQRMTALGWFIEQEGWT